MLAIRLSRFGTKKKPFYRVMVMEKSGARDGRSLELLGTYNPVPNPAPIELDLERLRHWVSKGAQPSKTVSELIRRFEQRQAEAAKTAPAA